MSIFLLTFTGNDGSPQEQDHWGTSATLVQHITALEELGCHGFTAEHKEHEVYSSGQLHQEYAS